MRSRVRYCATLPQVGAGSRDPSSRRHFKRSEEGWSFVDYTAMSALFEHGELLSLQEQLVRTWSVIGFIRTYLESLRLRIDRKRGDDPATSNRLGLRRHAGCRESLIGARPRKESYSRFRDVRSAISTGLGSPVIMCRHLSISIETADSQRELFDR